MRRCGWREKSDKLSILSPVTAANSIKRMYGVMISRDARRSTSGTCNSSRNPVRLMFTELRFRESKEIAMTKADLLAAVAAKTGVSSAEADRVISAFVDLVVESAKSGDKVSWPGFGSFSTSKRQARTGRNPRTGEPVQIAASTTMKFSPSSTLKAALNPNR